MEHCSSLPLWRPDRRVQQISGGTGHRPSRSDVPCRDDGSGQTARWVVATRPRVGRLVGLFLNGHPQVAASRRPRTEASARRSDNAKEGLTTDGPLQKPIILQAWLTLPSCLASSNNPTLARMIFWSVVMVSSNAPRRGASPPRPLRAPPRLAIRRAEQDTSVRLSFS